MILRWKNWTTWLNFAGKSGAGAFNLLSNSFLKYCIFKRVSPRFINKHIEKAKMRHSPTLERVFINDEIWKNHTKLQLLRLKLRQNLFSVSKFLSTFDYIRFRRYLADIEQQQRDLIDTKHFCNINWLLNTFAISISIGYLNNVVKLHELWTHKLEHLITMAILQLLCVNL